VVLAAPKQSQGFIWYVPLKLLEVASGNPAFGGTRNNADGEAFLLL
jgi:hypothetical protein